MYYHLDENFCKYWNRLHNFCCLEKLYIHVYIETGYYIIKEFKKMLNDYTILNKKYKYNRYSSWK